MIEGVGTVTSLVVTVPTDTVARCHSSVRAFCEYASFCFADVFTILIPRRYSYETSAFVTAQREESLSSWSQDKQAECAACSLTRRHSTLVWLGSAKLERSAPRHFGGGFFLEMSL